MDHKFILVVSDEGEGNRGEVTVLDTRHDVENTVGSLLEAGFNQTRIHVFAGGQAEITIAYRPVVLLMDDDSDLRARSQDLREHQADPELVPVAVRSEASRSTVASNGGSNGHVSEAQLASVVNSSVEAVRSEAPSLSVEARSFSDQSATQGHFSDLFRPAYGWSD